MINLYFMKNAVFDGELEALVSLTDKALDLPKDGWRFKMDEEEVGVAARWFLPATPHDEWTPIEIERFWGNKGATGPGWYRRDVAIPELSQGKRICFHFGDVDEELVRWIDRKYAGDYNCGSIGWDITFAIEVTSKLTAGKRHLALRVYNSTATGGVWKPVSIFVGGDAADREKEPAKGRSGRLLYTVTEPMDFNVSSGIYTIGNVIRIIKTNDESQLRPWQVKAHLWSPRYSSDGKRIAFVQDAGGRGQIYVMKEDSSEATNISDKAFCDRFSVWSADGGKIAFVSDRTGDWDIYTMNAGGRAQRRVAGNPGVDRAPAWSPDGKRLAWESTIIVTFRNFL